MIYKTLNYVRQFDGVFIYSYIKNNVETDVLGDTNGSIEVLVVVWKNIYVLEI